MSTQFPSLWLEFNNKGDTVLIGGSYREWSQNGNKLTEEEQVNNIKILTEQMERAANKGCKINWYDEEGHTGFL